jgi:hypothetical protein
MPVSFELLRGMMGVIGLGCAYMAGRALAAYHRQEQPVSRLYGWIIRMVLCLGAIVFRHTVDLVAMAFWGLAAVLFGVAYMVTVRRKPPEDLTDQIFPHES